MSQLHQPQESGTGAPGPAQRAEQLLRGRRQGVFESTDRIVAAALTLHGLAGAAALGMAPSPWALAAGASAGAAIVVAGAATLAASGSMALRFAMSTLLMVAAGLAPVVTGRPDLLPIHAAACLVLLSLYLDAGVLVAGLLSAVVVHAIVGATADVLEVSVGLTCVTGLLVGSCLRGKTAMETSAAGQAELERASQLARESEGRVRRQTVELRAVDDRFRLVCGSAPVGVALMGVDGELVYVNPRWSAISGLGPQVDARGAWARIVHEEDRPRVVASWRSALQGARGFSEEYRVLTPHGERIVHDRRASVLSEGRATGFVGFLEDVTRRRQAEDALREGKALAESASRAKSEFLANMSHEIRTPMNGILGLTELVLETSLTADQREQLALVKVSADALLVIVNDILDFSKVEAGKLSLDPIDFDLRDCIDEAVRGLAVGARSKGLQLVYEVQPDLPDAVHGDARRLRQVITNLVGNAIKFTERGEIAVEVRLREALARDRIRLEVTVSDTGLGISPDMQASIFEPFVQADTSTSRRFGGTGLGLAISSRFVALLGGQLSVTSQPGVGSCFRFDLQLRVREVVADEPFAGARLLLADGDAVRRRTMASLLRGWGGAVVFAATGAEAARELERAHRDGLPYHVVMVDAELPDPEGFALQVGTRAGAGPEVVHLGPDGDLRRTARPSMVRDTVARAYGRSQAAAIGAPPTRGGTNGRALKLLVADDNAVNRLVAVRFLESAGHRCVAVHDGRAVVAAVERERWDAILMDVQMPGVDGLQATAAIRRLEVARGVRTPIVAVTAHAFSDDRERCLATGMDAFVSKPLTRERLLATLDRLVAPAVVETVV